jgi:hypothetical protein
MLFQKRFWAGLADGSITVAFRRWDKPRVIAGRSYRAPGVILDMTAVDEVEAGTISDDDARAAGFSDVAALLAELPGEPSRPIYRIVFTPSQRPDPRAELAQDDALRASDIAEIGRRLDRLDRASTHGPWTHETLHLIAEHPARRAGDLAEMVVRERAPFKLDVRKLKNLGLTESLNIGYRLSPRGKAYLSSRGGPT